MRIAALLLIVFSIACGSETEDVPPPTPVTESVAEQSAVPSPVTAADEPAVDAETMFVETLATSIPELGAPAASIRDELRVKQWAQEGGTLQTERAPEGQMFFVVTFPETAVEGKSVSYASADYELRAGDARFAPHAVTVGGGYESLGPDVFQKDVFMTTRRCASNAPFAVAFLVPRDLGEANIAVKGVAAHVQP